MEVKVGEVYDVYGIKLKVVEAYGAWKCVGCNFLDDERSMCGFQKCMPSDRKNRKSVKFVKIYDI